ncbi:hypothetical protein AOC36_08640 [Erysipelothrix larvae]|uniref:O-antigen polymerase n=1 Tax=Erysipelothrix larvae TaxID=1514105 RepID=A0A120JTV5_9FIRM|nr:hypothetical protein [Erysipelothrix larvae]AMC94052.1 hypothetical protein AOC36_08640 [Erysipelothrix larvae]
MISRIKMSTFDRLVTFIIIVGPMFTQYSSISSVILLPELLIFPLLFYYFMRCKPLTILNLNTYFRYYCVVLILTLFIYFVDSDLNLSVSTFAFIRHIFYTLIIVSIGYKKFNIDYAAKTLIVIALINSLYGFIQYLAYNLLGLILPWHFSFLPLKYGRSLVENSNYLFSEFGYRFSGLFSEPAHFSQYVSIALLVILFYKSDKFKPNNVVKTIVSLIYILSLLLNGSGTGFAMIVFVIGLYFINSERKNIKSLFSKGALLSLGILFVVYITKNEIINGGLDRILSTSDVSSGNIRIFRPFYVFSTLPVLNRFIGVGYANYSNYVMNSSLATAYELSNNRAWTNTIGYILVGSGVVGFLFYISFILLLYRRTRNFYRYLVLLILLFALFTEVPLSFQFITIMGFINKGIFTKEISFIN